MPQSQQPWQAIATPSAPADWYPDPEAPSGHQRYWDGSAWTEHRWVAPEPDREQPPTRVTTTTATSAPVTNWVKRHKIVTGLIAAVTVVSFSSAVADTADDPPPSSDSQPDVTPDGDSTSSPNDSDDREDSSVEPTQKPKPRTYRVVDVVDGDTINLGNGETVRLAGIDAPEVGECGFKRSRNTLADLVLGKRVSLGASDEDHDQYGRLLRYVDVDGTDAGLRLIKAGLAIARYDSRDGYGFHPREPKYIKADRASPAFACAKPVPLVPQEQKENCAPGYSPCIPPYPPDLNCPDIGQPVKVTGSDPHGLDRDGDGIACEWS